MVDFATLRRNMVNGQVRANGVTHPALIAALLEVPREEFVPETRRALAYRDDDVPVGGEGAPRFLIEPMTLARMIQALDLTPADRVLHVGCASGYAAAVLARLARSVVALDADSGLAAQAGKLMAQLGIANVSVVNGPLAAGWPQSAPYDAIFVEGAVAQPPKALFGQLAEAGRLVTVVGAGGAGQVTLYRSAGGVVSPAALFNAAVPVLPGFAPLKSFTF